MGYIMDKLSSVSEKSTNTLYSPILGMGNPYKECGHVMWRSATIGAKIVTQLILDSYMTDLTISSKLLCWDTYHTSTAS